jgi:hypothetical protein
MGNIDQTVIRAAAALLGNMVVKRKDPGFFGRWQPVINRAVFEALLDRSHIGLVNPIGQVVLAMYRTPITAARLEQIVAATASDVVDDPVMAATFVQTLTTAATQSQATFLQLITDLMVSSGRANPSEMRVFANQMETVALARDVLGTEIPHRRSPTKMNTVRNSARHRTF